jgi:glycerophosphoryl diester phosphodiesterase
MVFPKKFQGEKMTKNYAHRGYCARYPENTMLAFQKAVEAGCDGIELDVQLTVDNRVVIIHDEDLVRTTNGKGFIKDKTLAELEGLDAGQGQHIPTIDEYFDFVQDLDIITNIELKNSIFPYGGMEQVLISMIRERKLESRVIFSSFNHESLRLCKSIAPEIKCGFLYDCRLIDGGTYARQHNIECLHPNYLNLTVNSLSEMHSKDIQVNTWTVNSSDAMEYMLTLGVDGIITNDPLLLHRISGARH